MMDTVVYTLSDFTAKKFSKDQQTKVEPLDILDMESLQKYKTFQKVECSLQLTCRFAQSTDRSVQDELFGLVKKNMEMLYKLSSWGWNRRKKRSQLTSKGSCYLMARDCNGKLAAMSHFKLEVEEGVPLVYCYELQVDHKFQRKGIGKFLMHVLFSLAYQLKFKKVVLTVFKHNEAALNFYRCVLGFELDESSPSEESCECYLILSKNIDNKVFCVRPCEICRTS